MFWALAASGRLSVMVAMLIGDLIVDVHGCSSISGQAQHPLGNDVALDFRSTAGDRAAERTDVAFEPAAHIGVEVQVAL